MKPTEPDLPLAVREEQPLAVRPVPTTGEMLMIVVNKGITSDNVSAFKELVQLQREERKLEAQKEFAAAFLALQRAMPTIHGCRNVNGQFVYANFDDIDAIVRPLCLAHDFTYSFHESSVDGTRITVTMTLEHKGGHFREIPFSVRAPKIPNSDDSKNDMGAHTYAKRGALTVGLSLRIVGGREDAREDGGTLTQDQADELERRVAETNSNKAAFLKVACAPTFREIKAGVYDVLDQMLRAKEKR